MRRALVRVAPCLPAGSRPSRPSAALRRLAGLGRGIPGCRAPGRSAPAACSSLIVRLVTPVASYVPYASMRLVRAWKAVAAFRRPDGAPKMRGDGRPCSAARLLRFGSGTRGTGATREWSCGCGLYAAVAAGGFRRYATYRIGHGGRRLHEHRLRVHPRLHLPGAVGRAAAPRRLRPGAGADATCGSGRRCCRPWSHDGRRLRGRAGRRGSATGDIAVDLYRPADLQLWWLARRPGAGRCSSCWGAGLVPLAVGALRLRRWRCRRDPVVWLAFLVAVALGGGGELRDALSGGAERVLAARRGGRRCSSAGLAGMFFSGMLLPLNAFPGALGEIARALPWAALLQVPADVLLGARAGAAAAHGVRLPGRLGGARCCGGAAAAVGGDAEGGGPGWLTRSAGRSDGPVDGPGSGRRTGPARAGGAAVEGLRRTG